MMAKKVKARRKRGKIIRILSLVTIMVAIITLSALYQSKPPPIQREPADRYFRISEAQAFAEAWDENKSITVSEVYFNITAVGGNVKDVVVSPAQGYVLREDYPYFEEMKQNQTGEISIRYRSTVFSQREDQGYPVYFEIECDKAEGRVTVYITEYFPPL
jgi:hypothetical protein